MDVPFSVTFVVEAAKSGVVLNVSCAVPFPPATLVGFQLQVTPAGRAGHVRFTDSVNPLRGATATVVVALPPAETLPGVSVPGVSVKDGMVAAQTCASALASIEPKPVT